MVVELALWPDGASGSSEAQEGRVPQVSLMQQIIELNPTATAGFLARFAESSLRHYLDRLAMAKQPRGRDSRWVRTGETPAIMARETID